MKIDIGTIVYKKGDDSFEIDEVEIISEKHHEEEGGYKEPKDNIITVKFKAETELGTITGQVAARRSGFDSDFIIDDDIDINIDNSDEEIYITTPDCTIAEDEEIY